MAHAKPSAMLFSDTNYNAEALDMTSQMCLTNMTSLSLEAQQRCASLLNESFVHSPIDMQAYSTEPSENCTEIGDSNPFIMVWWLRLIFIIAFASMVIVAAGGNGIVIWIVVAHKRMRTVTNYFLLNLAVADALISLMNALFNFIYMLDSDWPFGNTYCKISQFVATSTIAASTFTFMAIAIDRYIAIIHPLKPRMRAATVLGVIAFIWIVAILVAFPTLIFAETFTWNYCNGDKRTVCFMMWPDGYNGPTDFAYNIFIMLVTYFVPLFALAGTYTRVGLELWGSQAIGEVTQRQEESMRSKRKVVRMMIVVVVIFAVCWLPQHVYFLVNNRYKHLSNKSYMQQLYLCIYWVAMSNSMYNPIIYCWMNARFRQGFKYVFRFCPCVGELEPIGVSTKKLSKTAIHLGRTNTSLSVNSSKYTFVDNNTHRNGSSSTHLECGGNNGSVAGNACMERNVAILGHHQHHSEGQKQPLDCMVDRKQAAPYNNSQTTHPNTGGKTHGQGAKNKPQPRYLYNGFTRVRQHDDFV